MDENEYSLYMDLLHFVETNKLAFVAYINSDTGDMTSKTNIKTFRKQCIYFEKKLRHMNGQVPFLFSKIINNKASDGDLNGLINSLKLLKVNETPEPVKRKPFQRLYLGKRN